MHDSIIRDKDYLQIKKLVNMSLFISIAILLSLFEMLIPITFVIPGVKLGLANIILVILLFHYSLKDLIIYQFAKITITTFLLGLFSVYLFSLCGGMLALFMMWGAKKIFKERITVYTLSIIGAVFHNIGQTLFATFYLNTIELLYYLPWLVLFACISGMFIGFIVTRIQKQIERKLDDDSIQGIFSK